MFDKLKSGISSILAKIKSSEINEAQFDEITKEFKTLLLESDVALPTVKKFVSNLKEQIVSQKAVKGISKKETITKAVHDELFKLLDSKESEFQLKKKRNVILMLGLQGSGKTSTTAKLAGFIKKNFSNKSILLVSLDTYRPAAQEQLEILAKSVSVDSLRIVEGQKPMEICKRAMETDLNSTPHSKYDVIIFDTAGRITIDQDMMNELKNIHDYLSPDESLLVVDALIGQSSVEMAKDFSKICNITGIIMTRIDSDAKGGGAISVKDGLDRPIKFLCTGEKVTDIEVFHSDRIVSRIMDKGDIATLAEKMKDSISEGQAEKLTQRIMSGKFSLEDYVMFLKSIEKFGGIMSVMSFLPGMQGLNNAKKDAAGKEKEMKKHKVILQSMTKKEKKNPKILDMSRKTRISKGSGTTIEDINMLLKQFFEYEKMIKQLFSGNSRMAGMLKGLMK